MQQGYEFDCVQQGADVKRIRWVAIQTGIAE